MKIYNLPRLSEPSGDGIFRLGPNELKTAAVELVYGRLGPKEAGRAHSTPDGKAEVICVIKGSVRVERGGRAFNLSAGEAFFSNAGSVSTFSNPFGSEAAYIAAAGHIKGTAQPSKELPATPDAAETPVMQSSGHGAPEPIVEATEYDITREDTDPLD